jgi:hypothetical protein
MFFQAETKENRESGLSEKALIIAFTKRGERSQGLVRSVAIAEVWIGAKRRLLTSEGRQPLSFPVDTLQIETGLWRKEMQQSRLGEVMIYADITEVRQETRIAECKKLLENGWVLLGVYPLTTAGEEYGAARRKQNQPQDTKQHVRRLVGYIVGKQRAG